MYISLGGFGTALSSESASARHTCSASLMKHLKEHALSLAVTGHEEGVGAQRSGYVQIYLCVVL